MKFVDAEFERQDQAGGNLKGTKLEGTLPSQMDTSMLKQLSSEELEAQ